MTARRAAAPIFAGLLFLPWVCGGCAASGRIALPPDDIPPPDLPYVVVDTRQTVCYQATGTIACPSQADPYYGQDAQHQGPQPAYRDNGDGTITDLTTGLMWVKARGSKVSWDAAVAGASSHRTGGYSDWRMPTIKELYSLILFNGVNGSDCHIKGYKKALPPTWQQPNALYVRYVRSNPAYGKNQFHDNGDGTVTDLATALVWDREDSGVGLDWPGALAWVQAKNAASHLGHNDWRLPNIKELQSLVDYTRSPPTTASAAIDTRYFTSTGITSETGEPDYPYYWSSTSLQDGGPAPSGAYIAFGPAMGYMNGSWMDVHGAGSQKSDPMISNPANYPNGRGPLGDAVRITNFVRLVRGGPGE
jgi:hypothetical protein